MCSREETAGFTRRAREALAAAGGLGPPPALARVCLVDASTARGDLFDAAAAAADTRRAFHSPSTRDEATEEATETEKGIAPKPRNLGDLDAGGEIVPPVDFPRAVRALDGDVVFAEKMLRTFLADAESFTSKPLASLMPLAGDSEGLAAESVREREKPERAGTRLSEERRRDAERLGETADWLGAPPLRAAIATLLDGDAGEHAVRAAQRAVRDLRAFADGLESNIAGGGFGGNDLNDADASLKNASPGGSPLKALPKKSASTDQVMRSGLYAYSSSSLGTSGGGSADSNEDSDDKSAGRGSFGSDRDRDGRRSSTDSERFGSRRGEASRGSWGGSSGRVSADSAGAAEGAVTALAALSPRARARGWRRSARPGGDTAPSSSTYAGRWSAREATGTSRLRAPEKHASAAREQIAVLRAVLFVDASSSSSPLAQHDRSDAQVVASGIAQLRSIAEGASVSHAPRLMDAVEALANALVSAAAASSSRFGDENFGDD